MYYTHEACEVGLDYIPLIFRYGQISINLMELRLSMGFKTKIDDINIVKP